MDPVPPDTTSFHHAVDAANVLTAVFDNGAAPATFTTDPAGNLVCDGTYAYLYDGLNRLVQVNERGNATFDQSNGRIVTGPLGALVFRHTYDGLGRVIRKEQTESAQFTLPRLEDYYYDGIRRIQDVIRRPVAAPPPEPCDDVGFSKSGAIVAAAGLDEEILEAPGWMDELGAPIGPVLPPCDLLQAAHRASGTTGERARLCRLNPFGNDIPRPLR